MPESVSYTPNHAGLSVLAKSPRMNVVCVKAGAAILEAAKADAEGYRRTGKYAESFKVSAAAVHLPFLKRGPETRAGAIVENTAPYAAAVERRDNHRGLERAIKLIAGTDTPSTIE